MFDEVQRAVVVCAHPDDMETMMGGIVALLTGRGVEVIEVLATNGDIGASGDLPPELTRTSLAARRQVEAREAAAALGVRQVLFLDHPDGEIVPDLTLRAELALVYRRFQPDTLFTFDPWWPGQAHADHSAIGRAAIDAYMPSKMPLYRPEQLGEGVRVANLKRVFFFGGSVHPEVVVDITPYWEQKMRATLLHRSQFAEPKHAYDWLTKRNGEMGERIGVTYGEALAQMTVW